MENDLKKIKKLYGENMMYLCRDLFPTLLEQEGLLPKILTELFYPSKFLYDDLKEQHQEINFKNYIYKCMGIKNINLITTNKSPQELLSEAGYDLYECQTEADIQEFEKYYAPNEKLCTFNGGRLNNCHVFFAVKKNVDEIKREDFSSPQRQDDYGTSVISIQFTKGKINTLSIKNRYNHTVNNPDATFSNNLENIIPGLTKSFADKYYLNINQNQDSDFFLIGYVLAKDGRIYKSNYEENNICYGPDNIIIDNAEVKTFAPEKYLLIDYFLLDLHNKKIILYDKLIADNFIDGIKNIENITVRKIPETNHKQINIITKDNNIVIEINNTNQIIAYKDLKITKIGNKFLYLNQELSSLELPNLIEVGNSFLYCNLKLNKLDLPNLVRVGHNFLASNTSLASISFPKLEVVNDKFLYGNKYLGSISLPSLREVGSNFMCFNQNLVELDLPKLKNIGHCFLKYSEIKKLNLPNVIEIGHCFLSWNRYLSSFDAPKLEQIGNEFMLRNCNLKSLSLPNLVEVKDDFLFDNKKLSTFIAPKLQKVGNCFLYSNLALKNLNLPSLVKTQGHFLFYNEGLDKIEVPHLVSIEDDFLACNKSLTTFNAPLLQHVGYDMLICNKNIKSIFVSDLDESSHWLLSRRFELINHNREDELYEKTIVDVSKEKEENQISKETPKVRCKNGQ